MDLRQYLEHTRNTETLLKTLSYIQAYKGKTIVIHICGDLVGCPEDLTRILQDAVLLKSVGLLPVVIHDKCGNQAGGSQDFYVPKGLSSEEEDMFFSMKTLRLNKQMVGQVQSMGEKAIGIGGMDGDFFSTSINEGQLSNILDINSQLLTVLLEKEYLPIITTMSYVGEKEMDFPEAGEVACAVGGCLQSEKIVFLSRCEGIYDKNKAPYSLMTQIKFEKVTEQPFPWCSVQSMEQALRKGVKSIKLLDGRIPHGLLMEMFSNDGMGTSIIL